MDYTWDGIKGGGTSPYEKGKYMPILRNHRYIFTIKEVKGPGFATLNEAVTSPDNFTNHNIVVVPIVIGDIEQVLLACFLLQLIAGALVVRVIHFLQPLRWGFLQIQLPMSHGLGQLGILLGVFTADLERVGNAGTIPRTGVVRAGGNTNQVRPHEQIRAEQHDLEGNGGDERSFRLTGIADDADTVDGRLRTENERKRQDTQREQEASLVEQERFPSVDGHVR